MLSPREAAAHSRWLDPPDLPEGECPDCASAKARHLFFEGFRDLVTDLMDAEEADELLNPNNVYLDDLKMIADHVADAKRDAARLAGGMRCCACVGSER